MDGSPSVTLHNAIVRNNTATDRASVDTSTLYHEALSIIQNEGKCGGGLHLVKMSLSMVASKEYRKSHKILYLRLNMVPIHLSIRCQSPN